MVLKYTYYLLSLQSEKKLFVPMHVKAGVFFLTEISEIKVGYVI